MLLPAFHVLRVQEKSLVWTIWCIISCIKMLLTTMSSKLAIPIPEPPVTERQGHYWSGVNSQKKGHPSAIYQCSSRSCTQVQFISAPIALARSLETQQEDDGTIKKLQRSSSK